MATFSVNFSLEDGSPSQYQCEADFFKIDDDKGDLLLVVTSSDNGRHTTKAAFRTWLSVWELPAEQS